MQKPTFKHNKVMRKQAFTLIELLIVIAIIGILFIVLVSKVDFATDKAKATGVQTDFRSFQVALEQVSKENAGFNTFGWDIGDVNGDRVRNSYDEGDINKNNKQDAGEVWIGHKMYGEVWNSVYTLINPADSDDYSAIEALEAAINKNLDPKLHITINPDGTIVMANGYQDPWKTQYHGRYITNSTDLAAEKWNTDPFMTDSTGDGMDRGAIFMFSNGANQEFGTKVAIKKGIAWATVSLVDADTPDNNVAGKDDYAMAVLYTMTNGYGETMTITNGFSVNREPVTGMGGLESWGELKVEIIGSGQYFHKLAPSDLTFRSTANFEDFVEVRVNGEVLDPQHYTAVEGSIVVTIKRTYLETLPLGEYNVAIISKDASPVASFSVIDGEQTEEGVYINQPYSAYTERYNDTIVFLFRDDGTMDLQFMKGQTEICTYVVDGKNVTVTNAYGDVFTGYFTDDMNGVYCYELDTMYTLGDDSVVADNDYFYIFDEELNGYVITAIDKTKSTYPIIKNNVNGHPTVGIYQLGFYQCINMTELPTMPSTLTNIGQGAFAECTSLTSIVLPKHIQKVDMLAIYNCLRLKYIFVENPDIVLDVMAINTSSHKMIFMAAEEELDNWSACCDTNSTVEWGWKPQSTTYTLNSEYALENSTITSSYAIKLPALRKSGYKLVGWYDNPEFTGIAFNGYYYNQENTELYARWISEDLYNTLVGDGTSFETAYVLNDLCDIEIDSPGEYVYFKFVAPETRSYTFTSHSSNDTFGYLYNQDRNLLDDDDDSGENNNFSITYTMTAGQTYYFAVRYYDSSTTGSFSVSIT